jgi:hypothetical protein
MMHVVLPPSRREPIEAVTELPPEIRNAFGATRHCLYEVLDTVRRFLVNPHVYYYLSGPPPPIPESSAERFIEPIPFLIELRAEAERAVRPIHVQLTSAYNRLGNATPLNYDSIFGDCAHDLAIRVATFFELRMCAALARTIDKKPSERWHAVFNALRDCHPINAAGIGATMWREAVEAAAALASQRTVAASAPADAAANVRAERRGNRTGWVKRRYLELLNELHTHNGIVSKLVKESEEDCSRSTIYMELKAIRRADPSFPRARDRNPGKRTRTRSNRGRALNSAADRNGH